MAFKHYDVVRAASPSDLAKRITQKLKEGWQPYGSALISTAGYGAEFIQPVVSEGSISSPEEPGNRPTTSAPSVAPEYYYVIALAGQSNGTRTKYRRKTLGLPWRHGITCRRQRI